MVLLYIKHTKRDNKNKNILVRYLKLYGGLVVVMMEVHVKKDTVDIVDMMLVEVMVLETHIVVETW